MLRTTLFLTILVLLLLPACRDNEQTPEVDTAEAARLYGMIEAEHDSIMATYNNMAADMPTDIRQQYDEMEQLYSEAMPTYHGMMGHGMVDGMMAQPGQPHLSWSHMHSMHQRMYNLHSNMASELHNSGYESMARMHEQMLKYYDEAIALSGNGDTE